ncbi:MAG: hypothetical protein NTV87_05825 [Ignavibacteriae bacterium]|nr:hypothetical protein [Ignavibacteriota bacterium]
MIKIVHHILDTTFRKSRYNCPSDITKQVFDEIHNNYLKEYYIEAKTKPGVLNRKIGREIKKYWDLENNGNKKISGHPLIKSYFKHSNKKH